MRLHYPQSARRAAWAAAVILLAAALLAVLALTTRADPQLQAVISVNPSYQEVAQGGHIFVTVNATDMPPQARGWDFTLSFDPSLMSVDSPDHAAYGAGNVIWPDCGVVTPVFNPPQIDNQSGAVRLAAFVNSCAGAAASGPLATLTLTVHSGAATGLTTLDFASLQVADNQIPAQPVAVTPVSGQVFITVPTAADLALFTAQQQQEAVLVQWATVSEIGNAGFHLSRGADPQGPWTVLNGGALIPSQSPGSSEGFEYQYLDEGPSATGVYYYLLESVSFSGQSTPHGPIAVFFQGPTAVSLVGLSAGSTAGRAAAWPLLLAAALLGLLLAGLGLRRAWRA